MKTLNRIVAALAVAFGLSTAAQAAELSRDWQKMCTGVTYLGSTAPNNLQYASSQRGLAACVEIADSAKTTEYSIFDYNGDNRVQLKITTGGKYRLLVNSGNKFDVTSTESVTSGRHVIAAFVRRGLSGGGSHIISVIVYLDGKELFKVGDGSTAFITGPFRNISFGTSGSANKVSGALWNATEGCGNATTDAAKIAEVVADADILYPAPVSVTATVTQDITWSQIGWSQEITNPQATALELTVQNGATITLDGTFAYQSVKIIGDATIAAGDQLYTDGCWLKTLLGGTFASTGTISFAPIKSGFVGEYAKTDTGLTLRAQNKEVISINIGGGNGGGSAGTDSPSGYLVPDNDTYYGLAPVKGSTWNNISKQWQNNYQTITLKGSKAAAADGTLVERPSIDLSAAAKNTWSYGCTDPFLSGYLDDGGGVEVAVHGVPYTKYDVIVYATSDSGRVLKALTVNGTKYTYQGGATVPGSSEWGVGMSKTAAFGKNALYVSGLSGEELSISCEKVSSGGRATLCAVQVICQGNIDLPADYYGEMSGDVNWVDGKSNNLSAQADPWNNGQLSNLTITNVADSATLTFQTATTGQVFRLVSEDGMALAIPHTSLDRLSFVRYDFTETLGKVTVDLSSFTPAERTLLRGEIAGGENLVFTGVAAGWGVITDSTGIHYAQRVDTWRQSPTTVDSNRFEYVFIGSTDGDWSDKSNWRKASDGYLVAYDGTYYPQQNGGDAAAWNSALFDGAMIPAESRDITCETVEGWQAKLGFYNGVNVKIDRLRKFAASYFWIDATSHVEIDKVGGSASQYSFLFYIASENGLVINTIEQAQNIPFSYNFGDTGSMTYAGGISSGEHKLKNGLLTIGGTGFTGGSLSVTNSAALAFTNETAELTAAVTVSPESTLTIGGPGKITIGNKFVNNGKLRIAAGTAEVEFIGGAKWGDVEFEGETAAIYGFVVSINDCGRFTPDVSKGYTTENVKLYDAAGNLVDATVVDDHFEFAWNYTGTACWWDYEFDQASGQNPVNTGSDTKRLELDGDRSAAMKALGEYATNIVDNVTNIALRVPNRPWRDVSTWPTTATFMFYGKMVGKDLAYQLAFGSKNGGGNQLFFATHSVAEGTVDLCFSVNGAAPTVLCTMNVPDAQSSDHLYAVVLKDDADGNTVVNTYLDGNLLQPYTHTGKLRLGAGFQIASGHGGIVPGYGRPDDDDPATMDWLRVYSEELNAAVMSRLAEIYPYESTKGKAVRTVTAADTEWVADMAWTQIPYEGESVVTNAPNPDTTVELTVAESATLALNLATNANYEALKIIGAGELTLTGADGAVVPSVSGKTTIGTDVTVAYDAIHFGNLAVEDGKTLAFDFATLDLSQEFADRKIRLTGVATCGDNASIVVINLTPHEGRDAELVFDSGTQQYSLVITVDKSIPFVYTIAEGGEGEWSWYGEAVTREIVDANRSTLIRKDGDGALEMPVDRTFSVTEGTLRAGEKSGTASVSVDGDSAIFDVNGQGGTLYTVTLNGGTLANFGTAIGDASQTKTLIVGEDGGTIDGTAAFALQSQGYGPTTIELGENALYKVGTGRFALVNTTINGTGDFYLEEGTLHSSENTTFTNGTLHINADAVLLNRSGRTLTIANVFGGGGLLQNEGTVTGFTLGGQLRLGPGGTYNIITLLDSDTLLDVGTKHGLWLAGIGTVNATLTDAEMESGMVTVFSSESEDVMLGTITYNGADITDKCTIEGGTITAIDRGEAKIGNVYYETLTAAITAAEDGQTIELIRDAAFEDGLVIAKNLTFQIGADLTLSNAEDTSFAVNGATIGFTGDYGTLALAGSIKLGTWGRVDLPKSSTLTPDDIDFAALFADPATFATVSTGAGIWRYDGDDEVWKGDVTMVFQGPNGNDLTSETQLWGNEFTTDVNYLADLPGYQRTGYWFDRSWQPELPERFFENETYLAGCTAITYRVTYELGGVPGAEHANPESYTIESETITLAAATATGYTFVNWTNSTGTVVTEIATGSTGDRTLYAVFNQTPGGDWPDPQEIEEGTKASDVVPGVPTALAKVDARKLVTWASGVGGVPFAQAADIRTDAYLLNCANTADAVEAAKAGFKFSGITVDEFGTVTLTGIDGENYNGKLTILGSVDFTDWHEKTDGDKFFQAQLAIENVED